MSGARCPLYFTVFFLSLQAQREREEMQYPYSGSDDEQPEANVAGEPSSIIQAPGENTLRKNFQVLQEQNKAIEQQRAAAAAQQQAMAAAAANGQRHQPEKKERKSSRKEEAPPPDPGPPHRPPLMHGSQSSNPPGPPPQRPLPPPPGQAGGDLPAGAVRREEARKPSTPPGQQQRNSRLIQPNQARKPEDLDVLAAQLNELGSSPRNSRQQRPRQSSQEGRSPAQNGGGGKILTGQPQPPPMVEDDDDSSDDEGQLVQKDGTLQVNDPVPKPLRDLRRGPGRPLPPTPDDDDTLRRASNNQNQSPGGNLANSRALLGNQGQVMPDLLPQQSSPGAAVRTSMEGVPNLEKQRSFMPFGFSAEAQNQVASRRESHGPSVNVTPTSHDLTTDTPEIRKYKKRFNSEILCAALWGVNLLIGTENGLMLLDRSGQGKVYQLISRRRFQQMEVLEGQNILVTISGKKNRVRVYYLSWLKSKILRTDNAMERRAGWINVGDLQGAVHFKIVKYERIKFLVIALRDSIEIYAWAPKPYHKFMAFKSFSELQHRPLLVDLTVEEGTRLKVLYGSASGFHAVDLDSASVYDIYLPKHSQGPITPHTIVTLPNSNGMQLLLCYDNEGVYVNTYGKVSKNIVLQWGELPTSVAYIGTGQIMGWGNKAIEIRSVETGHLDGVFMHKKAQRLKFLCERNDKVFFSSAKGGSSCQIYFMTLNKPGLTNW